MTSVAALALASLNTFLGPRQAKNEKVYNKRAVLAAVQDHLGDQSLANLSDQGVEDIFTNNIEQLAIDMSGNIVEGRTAESVDLAKERKKPEAERILPLYIFRNADQETYYILSIRGNGLWDEIWGCVALEDDLRTVAGASFDHKGETPGLGAEIKDNSQFPKQFVGKQITADDGSYTSVVVKKGGASDPSYQVDGISGATVTCDGVTEMLYRGIKYYQPYLEQIEKKS